jgi:WD40 repeat protein
LSGTFDCLVRMWNSNTGELKRVLEGHPDAVECVAFSPDGTRVMSGSRDTSVRVWNAATGDMERIGAFKGS